MRMRRRDHRHGQHKRESAAIHLLDGKTQGERAMGSSGPYGGGAEVAFLGPDESRLLALRENCSEEAAQGLGVVAGADAWYARMVG